MTVRRWTFADKESVTAILPSAAFIALNILDACLTGLALERGSYELNALLVPILASNTVFKWLISSAVVLVLVLLKRHGLLKLLSLGMLLVCVWNGLAICSWS